MNFKDLPFELWEIKKYSNNTIVLNQHRSSSKESIDTLSGSSTNNVIQKVNKEVKVVDEDVHLTNTSNDLREIWLELKEKILTLDDLEFVPKNNYINSHGNVIT